MAGIICDIIFIVSGFGIGVCFSSAISLVRNKRKNSNTLQNAYMTESEMLMDSSSEAFETYRKMIEVSMRKE